MDSVKGVSDDTIRPRIKAISPGDRQAIPLATLDREKRG